MCPTHCTIVDVAKKSLKTRRQWQGRKPLAFLTWSGQFFFNRGVPVIKKIFCQLNYYIFFAGYVQSNIEAKTNV